MFVYRLTTRKYTNKLYGKGASLYGNRWNSVGTPMIYSAENRALALAEIVVHLSAAALPVEYVMLKIKIPNSRKFDKISTDQLDSDWNAFPHKMATQKIGDQFIRSINALILKVPSTVVHGDSNILINPLHKDFDKVKIVEIQDFPLDNRLF